MKCCGILTLVGGALSIVATPSVAQTGVSTKRMVYGGRVNDRGRDLDDVAVKNHRMNTRIDSRIDSRLSTRLDRFVSPKEDDKSSYTPKVDDRTKTGGLP